MAYICTICFVILTTTVYNVSSLPGRGHNQHVDPQDTTEYYWKNCRHLYQDLHEDMISVDKEYTPREKYYKLVVKVYVAFNRGLLERVRGSWSSDSLGKNTERYRLPDCERELILPSISEYRDAITYLQNNSERKRKKTPNSSHNRNIEPIVDDSSESSVSSDVEFSSSFNDNPVRDMQIDMLEIPLNSEPGEKYYKLVLKVDESIRRRLIKVMDGTLHSGENGINTELYKVKKTNEELRFPSIREVYRAKSYLKTMKGKELRKNTKRVRQVKTAKQSDLDRKSQYNYKESDTSSYEVQSRKANRYTSQGKRERFTDDEKVEILNGMILQQQRETRQQGSV